MLYKNLGVDNGVLTIGGVRADKLVNEYGTPLYVFDENIIRENMSAYREALKNFAPVGSMPFFASKACSFKEMYRIAASEKIGSDMVSPGEIYTACSAGFNMENSIFHGNCKTDENIEFAINSGVGYFASDTFEELEAVDRIALKLGKKQKILLRLSPGIDAHTFEAVNTGNIDSKFGFPMFSGDAKFAYEKTKGYKNLIFSGLHCHLGSQITDITVYYKAIDILLEFISKNNIDCDIINLGGGFGVAYSENETTLDIYENTRIVCCYLRESFAKCGLKCPKIFMEPGRSIVANAGTTLYRVGSVKVIPGIKNYVAIDGGMTDNPRYALYKSVYTVLNASKMNLQSDFICTIAGRCCESGDIVQPDVAIPKPEREDIIAVLCTGAYNFSMQSNYNRICHTPVVMVKDGVARIAVKRQSYENLTSLDV